MTYDRIVAVNGRHGRAIDLEGRVFAWSQARKTPALGLITAAMGNHSTPLELLFFRPRHLTVDVPPVPKLGLELQYKDGGSSHA